LGVSLLFLLGCSLAGEGFAGRKRLGLVEELEVRGRVNKADIEAKHKAKQQKHTTFMAVFTPHLPRRERLILWKIGAVGAWAAGF